MDAIAQFKDNQKAAWAGFQVLEALTGTVAPTFIKWAGITGGNTVLDVGCGTGVAALAAARTGARVTGVDLTPELVARAKENAQMMNLEGTFLEGDAEAIPLPDASFDVVISQFGHMFAPRPDVAVKEMLRVLKPGGTLAFTSWPSELFVGRMFAVNGRYAPPPPPGVEPPAKWGHLDTIRERLGAAVKDVSFTRGEMMVQALSPAHYRQFMETSFGPSKKLNAMLEQSDPAKAQQLRREVEALAAEYWADGFLRQGYLATRATKV